MTEERLRAHWFGGPQVPFWNYDPAQLTIGLEVEYFIAKVEGDSFTLATKQQYLDTMAHLVASAGYKDRNLPDQPGRISKDTSSGFIAIKPDFAWHILEVALPPRKRPEDIRELLDSTFSDVDAALARVGLQRLDLSCLPCVPSHMELVKLDRLEGFLKGKYKPNDDIVSNPQLFPALITATHVHINCANEESLRLLPLLYRDESEAQRRFVRAKSFDGKLFDNVRSYFYEHAFGPGFLLRTVPERIPNSLASYVEAFNGSTRIFPNDRFFPVRDMSYIRPTRQGTLEFRSACSFKSVDSILEVVAFRMSQVVRAANLFKATDEKGRSL